MHLLTMFPVRKHFLEYHDTAQSKFIGFLPKHFYEFLHIPRKKERLHMYWNIFGCLKNSLIREVLHITTVPLDPILVKKRFGWVKLAS